MANADLPMIYSSLTMILVVRFSKIVRQSSVIFVMEAVIRSLLGSEAMMFLIQPG